MREAGQSIMPPDTSARTCLGWTTCPGVRAKGRRAGESPKDGTSDEVALLQGFKSEVLALTAVGHGRCSGKS